MLLRNIRAKACPGLGGAWRGGPILEVVWGRLMLLSLLMAKEVAASCNLTQLLAVKSTNYEYVRGA